MHILKNDFQILAVAVAVLLLLLLHIDELDSKVILHDITHNCEGASATGRPKKEDKVERCRSPV